MGWHENLYVGISVTVDGADWPDLDHDDIVITASSLDDAKHQMRAEASRILSEVEQRVADYEGDPDFLSGDGYFEICFECLVDGDSIHAELGPNCEDILDHAETFIDIKTDDLSKVRGFLDAEMENLLVLDAAGLGNSPRELEMPSDKPKFAVSSRDVKPSLDQSMNHVYAQHHGRIHKIGVIALVVFALVHLFSLLH